MPRRMVQARTSGGEVSNEVEEAVAGVDEAVEAGLGEAERLEELAAF